MSVIKNSQIGFFDRYEWLDIILLSCVIVISLISLSLSAYSLLSNTRLEEEAFPGVEITETYSLNKYHVAGGDEYIYVIDFKFKTAADTWRFIHKIESLRRME